MAAYLDYLCMEHSHENFSVKQLEPKVISDILKGRFRPSRTEDIYFSGKDIFENTSLLLAAPLISGNHWCFLAINLESQQLVFMDPKADTGIDYTLGSRYIHQWQGFCRCWNNKRGGFKSLPTVYTLHVERHAIQAAEDGNNCGIYTLAVRTLNIVICYIYRQLMELIFSSPKGSLRKATYAMLIPMLMVHR